MKIVKDLWPPLIRSNRIPRWTKSNLKNKANNQRSLSSILVLLNRNKTLKLKIMCNRLQLSSKHQQWPQGNSTLLAVWNQVRNSQHRSFQPVLTFLKYRKWHRDVKILTMFQKRSMLRFLNRIANRNVGSFLRTSLRMIWRLLDAVSFLIKKSSQKLSRKRLRITIDSHLRAREKASF